MFLDNSAAFIASGLTSFVTQTRRDLERINSDLQEVTQKSNKPLPKNREKYSIRGTFKYMRADLLDSIKHTPKEDKERRARLKKMMKEAGYPEEYWYL